MPKKTEILNDIIQYYFSEFISLYPPSAKNKIYGGTFSARLGNSVKYLGRSIKELFATNNSQKIAEMEGRCWIYVLGHNNFNSLSFLENKIGDTVYVSPFRFQKEDSTIHQLKHPSRLGYLLKNMGSFFRLFLSGRPEVNRAWDIVFKATGLYEYSIALLKKHQPKAIVFANDTTLEPRAMLHASLALGIPSFYIQHACIGEINLPLLFSCSLLEGQDTLDKYMNNDNVKSDVKLVGIPKMDAYLSKKNTRTKVSRIAICSNLIDPIEAIGTVINKTLAAFPECTITYRPHPTDSRHLDVQSDRLKISNSREEKVFDFLLKQDLIIAGNTSTHYEAAILNVVSIYYKFDATSPTDDLYSFVKKGLIKKANTFEDLKDIIKRNVKQKENLSEKAKYYNAVLGTPNEGKSQKLVIQYIQQYLNKNEIEDNK